MADADNSKKDEIGVAMDALRLAAKTGEIQQPVVDIANKVADRLLLAGPGSVDCARLSELSQLTNTMVQKTIDGGNMRLGLNLIDVNEKIERGSMSCKAPKLGG